MLKLHSIETFGTQDGPGIRLILFLQGCNMHCLYCHNVDTQDPKATKTISIKEILELLEKQKTYFGSTGGLTISGGEPILQATELIALFKKVKKKGYNIVLDTNGSIFTDEIKKLYSLTDLILFDIKQFNDERHKTLTGISNQNVLKSIQERELSGKPMWLRYVLVPGYSDQIEDLEALGQYFANYKQIEKIEILPYHTFGVYKYQELGLEYKLKDIKTPTPEIIEQSKLIFNKYFKEVIVK